MNSTSDKILVVVLVIGIVVLLLVTMLGVSKLKKDGVTGYDTLDGYGNVNVSVTSNTAINLTRAHIDFGIGSVSALCNNCSMNTTGFTDSVCCIGFNTVNNGLEVENIGNTNLSLTLKGLRNGDNMVGGTNPSIQFYLREGELGSCKTTTNYDKWFEAVGPTTPLSLCDIMYPEQANDDIKMEIYMRIPDDSNKGLLNTTVNFTATTVT